MKMMLLPFLALVVAGCSTSSRLDTADSSAIPAHERTAKEPGVLNTAQNTGNPPRTLTSGNPPSGNSFGDRNR